MSLRLRLLLAAGVVALIALVAADLATYSALHSFLFNRIDQQLADASRIPGLGDRPPGGGPEDHGPGGPGPGFYSEVRDSNGAVSHPTGGTFLPNGETAVPKLPAKITGLHPSGRGDEQVRYLTVPASKPGVSDFRVRVSSTHDGGQQIVAIGLGDVTGTLHRLFYIELAVTGAALVAAGVLGWWLVYVGLRPLRAIEDTAEAIAEGDLDRRVPGDTARTEVGRLARVLNTMLARIQDAFAQRDATEARLRRFVADASHELRTPVAAVSAYAELFERGAKERPEDLARVMAGIRTETGRMGHLVDDLLLLARLDQGRPLQREPVELVTVTAQAVDAAQAVGADWPVRLLADEPVEVVGDESRLRQVVDNLLANVRAHTPPGTDTVVRIGRDGEHASLTVTDTGPGMTEEQASRVFERFYRAEASRSRQYGGTGLGLSIVAAIVAAHDGTVTLTTEPGAGASFTIRLPVAHSDEAPDPRRSPTAA
jgi:two-component system, OmpR family, sensor kinase